jgi:undecaprenyl-phosphate 4-deoxy-4-formamido-L-arabinose transferase
MKLISFVIPCYKSKDTIGFVVNEIINVVSERREEYDYEIILVNDCSPDDTIYKLQQLAEQNKKIKLIDLAMNVGKHGAIMAAYSKVKGDFVVGIDDDGQCPTDRLWDLIHPLEQGHDMSMAQYPVKKQQGYKNIGSVINNKMSQIMLEKPSDLVFSNFTARQKFVCDEMRKYPNPYPYLEGLSLRTTRDVVLVPMEERSRMSGQSGYTLKKSLSLWFNGFTAFSVKPLRVASVVGFFVAVAGFLFGFYTIIHKILNPSVFVGYSSLMVVLLFLCGIMMMMLGMIGEYLGRIYICINRAPQYVIRRTMNLDTGNEDE